jgi:hypothetical protein
VSEYHLVTTVKILRSEATLGSLWFPQTVLLSGVCGNQTQQNKIFGGVLGPSADFSSGVMGKIKMPNIFFLKNFTFILQPAFIYRLTIFVVFRHIRSQIFGIFNCDLNKIKK